MVNDVSGYLHEMRERASALVAMYKGQPVERLQTERIFRSATEREFSVMGEALFRLHESAPKVAEQVLHWKAIIGLRNRLVAGESLEPQLLFEIVRDDLPPFIAQLVNMCRFYKDNSK
jgi:uncharacterized protein with HEPN domain